jgi:hypothetical protein
MADTSERQRPQYRDKLKEYFDSRELLRSPSQAASDLNERPRPQFGDWWGWWVYRKDNTLNLYIDKCSTIIYYIKIDEYKTLEDIFLLCFEMIHKRWVDTDTAGSLLIAICDIKQDEIQEISKQKIRNK